MGTIVITQAEKTYTVIQSNIGLRVEFEGKQILIHRPDAENTPPTAIDQTVNIQIGEKP